MFGAVPRVGKLLGDGQCGTKHHLITVPDNDETQGMKCLAAYFGAYLTRSLCAKSLLTKPGLVLLCVFKTHWYLSPHLFIFCLSVVQGL